MKISVTGKGGSGKSMISVLLAKALAAKGYRVLLVDADESNPGLKAMLGIEEEPKPLMEDRSAGPESVLSFESTVPLEAIPPEYISQRGGIGFMSIGKIERFHEGCACPLATLSRDLLSHVELGENTVLIADHEGGVEHFGRGVPLGMDKMLVVVEPSFQSVMIASKIWRMNQQSKLGEIDVAVVLNKVTPEVEGSLRAGLDDLKITVLGSIRNDPGVFKACFAGAPLDGVDALKDVEPVIAALGL